MGKTNTDTANDQGATAPVFSLEKLREDCKKLFGVEPFVFDGATYGMTGEYTVDDMRAHINTWLNTPIDKLQ